MIATDNKTKVVSRKTTRTMGYEMPQFTSEEFALKRKYEQYVRWSPGMRRFVGPSLTPVLYPQPENVELSPKLLEKIKMYNEWVSKFNDIYCK